MSNELKQIGKNLKLLRTEFALNQQQIANFIGVDQSLISKIEKGERTISVDALEKLNALYGVTMQDIRSENVFSGKLSIAFRTSDLSQSDLEVILAVNKIALNLRTMQKLLEVE